MARSLNQCNFIGNLGGDPEIKVFQDGSKVANFSIAISDDYKDKQTGQKVEKTEWIPVTAFGKLADIVGQYMKKGSKVFVTGKMVTRSYEKDGVKHYKTEINANNIQMLDGKPECQVGGYQQPAQQQQQAPAQAHDSSGFSDFDDDINF